MLLAVSGGPDSTALMHAAAAGAGRAGPALHVATVDHGLRPDSAAEAEAVARGAAGLGLPHHRLRWEGPHPATGLQAAAREARYRLLAACAGGIDAGLLLTGHTRDDQAETVLMRLLAGSGPAGLAGMRAERPLGPGLILARPFLGLPKAALVAWCRARGLATLRDPSNADPRFGRARLRALMPALAREGLSAARLVRLAERAARDEAALGAAAAQALAAALREEAPGRLGLDGAEVAALPDAVALRLLDRALDRAGGAGPRRLERLERLALEALLPALRAGRPLRRTLRGLLIEARPDGGLSLRPAPRRGGPRPGSDPHGRHGAGDAGLLGKGEPTTYIGPECDDDPTAAGKGPGAGLAHSPRMDR
ncbi:tRNA lysidine(34) synthetase TilS [Methylobacterium planeticum]|uniref:tRNA(Ile)-lysidine synthase n=1 Tax=Methylobacterium planeticum TaxID=2615211 RepID=A0A6N6MVL6_9HYPH|nr:tRNA lysidine(34) synthetase TilS [Methylobacterium planeticum]KAB1074928.1 tRNA lysidine(34) synthetase TilS [Methylobacterium planeticum]